MTIIEFIEARIAEEAVVARAAGGDRWAYNGEDDAEANGEVYRPDATRAVRGGGGRINYEYAYVTCDSEGLTAAIDQTEGAHIALQDPASVLRRCDGVRRAIDAEILNLWDIDGEWGDGCKPDRIRAGQCDDRRGDIEKSGVLRALASFWSTHVDYNREWS